MKLVGITRTAALAVTVGLGMSSASMPASAQSTGCLPSNVKSTLKQIEKKFGSIRVVSTHRPGARIAGSGHRSYHASCRAVDFDPPKGKYEQVVRFLKSNFSGGVGTYSCSMHHIHIDDGPQVRWHKCV